MCNPKSTGDSILCCWQLLRSNGAKITSFRLQRKRLRGRPNPDASDSSDSEGDQTLELRVKPATRKSSQTTTKLALTDTESIGVDLHTLQRRTSASQSIQDALALGDIDVKLTASDGDESKTVTTLVSRRSLSLAERRAKEHWSVACNDLPVVGVWLSNSAVLIAFMLTSISICLCRCCAHIPQRRLFSNR